MFRVGTRLKIAGVKGLHDQSNAFGDPKIREKANEPGEDDAGTPVERWSRCSQTVAQSSKWEKQREGETTQEMRCECDVSSHRHAVGSRWRGPRTAEPGRLRKRHCKGCTDWYRKCCESHPLRLPFVISGQQGAQ